MKKEITLTIDGKQYQSSYYLKGDMYFVNTDFPELAPYIMKEFWFKIEKGQAVYLVLNAKTHDYARQIITQINKNEFKK